MFNKYALFKINTLNIYFDQFSKGHYFLYSVLIFTNLIYIYAIQMYTKDIRFKAIELRKNGLSYQEIADNLDISRSCAQNLITYKMKPNKNKIGPKFNIT